RNPRELKLRHPLEKQQRTLDPSALNVLQPYPASDFLSHPRAQLVQFEFEIAVQCHEHRFPLQERKNALVGVNLPTKVLNDILVTAHGCALESDPQLTLDCLFLLSQHVLDVV